MVEGRVMNTCYYYYVMFNNQVLLDCIECNRWEDIEEDWNKRGLQVRLVNEIVSNV